MWNTSMSLWRLPSFNSVSVEYNLPVKYSACRGLPNNNFLLSIVCLFMSIFSQSLLAQQLTAKDGLSQAEREWIKQHPEVRLGGGPDWAPFDFFADGAYQGVANDVLQLVAQKTGLNFVLTIDTWNNNLKKIRNGDIDILGAVYYTEDRSRFLNFSSPYIEVLDYFFVRDDLSVTTIAELNGKRVAVPDKYAHGELLKKHYPGLKIITVSTFTDAIDAVLENRADILFDTYAALSYALKKEGINTIIPFKSTRHLGANPIHIATPKAEIELASIVQKGLDAITEEELQIIYYRWMGRNPKESKLDLSRVERSWLKENPRVTVGGSPDWTPFNFADNEGNYQGVAHDYLRLIAKKTGLSLDISIAPWAENLQKAKKGEIDLLGAVYYTEDRERYLNFSRPYFEVLDYFFIRDDVDALIFNDLNGMRVAVPEGYAHIGFLEKNFPKIEIVRVATFGAAIDAVLEGRAELLYDTYGSLIYTFEKKGINTIIPFKSTARFGDKYIHIATAKGKPELASIVQKGLDAITEVEQREISRRWLGSRDEDLGLQDRIELTETEQTWLLRHPQIRFTGDPNWLPYEAFDKQGRYIGIVAEYLALIEDKLGINIEVVPVASWAEAVKKIKSGAVDIISETSNSDLNEYLSFSSDYVSSPLVMVMKKDAHYVESVEDIKHKKIAVIRDYGYVPEIINKYPNLHLHRVDSIQEGLTAVSVNRVDVLIATLAQASYHISELGINNIRIVGKTEFETKLAFGMRDEFTPLIPLFNRALNSIGKDQRQKIMSKYGHDKYLESINYRLLVQVAVALLLIILFTLYWNRKLAREVGLRKLAEEQTKILIDKIPLQIVVTSYDGRILSANPKALNDHKIDVADIDQYNIMEFYQDQSDREAVIKELAEKGMVEQMIVPMRGFKKGRRKMMLSITPIVYQNNSALLSIALDLTQRLEFEEALGSAKDAAEAATLAKSEFLANMSHEIRTPMNAILGFAGLLSEQVQDPKLKSFVNTIQTAGNNLLVLINDILDLSKIEAGKLHIEKAPCNLAHLFAELDDIFRLKVAELPLSLVFDIDPQLPPSLHLDEVRLRQVLFNLLGNAIKFTEQGEIRVCVHSENEDVIHSTIDLALSVEDSGIGISGEQQEAIFQQFAQSSGQDTKKYGGTGLGLSISRRLVEMMGGTLTLSSQLGKGANFSVYLPGVNVASLMVDPVIGDASTATEIDFLAAKILVVDDVEDNRELLLANFADTPLVVCTASNGLEALELASAEDFDLILMDIRMPLMDGYEAAEKIKQRKNTPIIALTASVMSNELSQIKQHKFDGYLRKPVSRVDLFDELSKFLPCEAVVSPPVLTLATVGPSQADLSEIDYKALPLLIDELGALSAQHKTISEDNNLSAITRFANELLDINSRYPFEFLTNYAEQLIGHVEIFDIAAIQRSINDFPQLQLRLESIVESQDE